MVLFITRWWFTRRCVECFHCVMSIWGDLVITGYVNRSYMASWRWQKTGWWESKPGYLFIRRDRKWYYVWNPGGLWRAFQWEKAHDVTQPIDSRDTLRISCRSLQGCLCSITNQLADCLPSGLSNQASTPTKRWLLGNWTDPGCVPLSISLLSLAKPAVPYQQCRIVECLLECLSHLESALQETW